MRMRLLVISCASFCLALPMTADDTFIGDLDRLTTVASTVPQNGDLNPYGVAVVPYTTGALVKGDVLVSNFNNAQTAQGGNLQGTGTTIVEISPTGAVTLFAQLKSLPEDDRCPGGIGLTTALVALRAGWVIVGSLPTTDGTSATAKAGCLIVLNRWGKPVETFAGHGIDGPWDMTALDLGNAAVLFLSNVLDGTIVRLTLSLEGGEDSKPEVLNTKVIASGFPVTPDPSALEIGPTGLGLGGDGTLYVADTKGNRVAAIEDALFRSSKDSHAGTTVSAGGALMGPLGLAIAPGGDILTVNSGDGNLVEITPQGKQVAKKNVDTSGMGAGTLFGLAIAPNGNGVYLVDDGNNTLSLLSKGRD